MLGNYLAGGFEMSVNKLIRQSLGLFEGIAAMPFQVIQKLWNEETSTTSTFIKQAAQLSEGLATMPFKFAREIFEENGQDANNNPPNDQANQPQG